MTLYHLYYTPTVAGPTLRVEARGNSWWHVLAGGVMVLERISSTATNASGSIGVPLKLQQVFSVPKEVYDDYHSMIGLPVGTVFSHTPNSLRAASKGILL